MCRRVLVTITLPVKVVSREFRFLAKMCTRDVHVRANSVLKFLYTSCTYFFSLSLDGILVENVGLWVGKDRVGKHSWGLCQTTPANSLLQSLLLISRKGFY